MAGAVSAATTLPHTYTKSPHLSLNKGSACRADVYITFPHLSTPHTSRCTFQRQRLPCLLHVIMCEPLQHTPCLSVIPTHFPTPHTPHLPHPLTRGSARSACCTCSCLNPWPSSWSYSWVYCRSSKRRLAAAAAPGAAVTAAAAEPPPCVAVAEPSVPSDRSCAQGGGDRWGVDRRGLTGGG